MLFRSGLVRSDDGLIAMTLDHYPGMCESQIAAHIAEAKTRWPIIALRIVHRVGRLMPDDRIVFVGVASMHRQAAFQAAEFLMDYLKTRAPFWKQVEYADGKGGGEKTWVDAKPTDDALADRWARPGGRREAAE